MIYLSRDLFPWSYSWSLIKGPNKKGDTNFAGDIVERHMKKHQDSYSISKNTLSLFFLALHFYCIHLLRIPGNPGPSRNRAKEKHPLAC